ncbi:DEAD/DEAH box helicase family protein, partial [bacterium]|nr:DEAD/DEAH box helicase family protein [bacterium]
MILRPYQEHLVQQSIKWMLNNIAPFCVEAATGAGKSIIISEVARIIHHKTGKRVLCLAPTADLVKQNISKYKAYGLNASVFSASAGAKELRHPVVFGSPLTVKNKIRRFQKQGDEGYALVIIDECFTADTMISTPRGEVPINSLRNGDIVCNAVGSGNVVTTFAKAVYEIYEVKLSNGKTIKCTGNHPFFTKRGWAEAKSLMEGEIVFRKEDLSCLQRSFSADEVSSQGKKRHVPATGVSLEQAGHLLAILRKEIEEPDAHRIFPQKDGSDTQKDRSQAKITRRKRNGADRTSEEVMGNTGRGLALGTFRSNESRSQERGVSKPLQDRPGAPGNDDSNRGRRWKSLQFGEAKTGPKKDRVSDQIRVESVSRVELKSPETVYNLHVSGHPSYYAGGVLVHNCHGITPTIRHIIERMREGNPNLRVMGLTATPYRL